MIFSIIKKIWAYHDKKVLSKIKETENIIQLKNIPYGSSVEHSLDIYHPKVMNNKLPAIINIHGGGFIYGDKEINRFFCLSLCKEGFIVFNVNYRLIAKNVKVPEQIKDILIAFEWICENISLYPASPNDVFLTGESAGAYLALLSCMIAKSKELMSIFNINVKKTLSIKALGLSCGFFNWADKKLYAPYRLFLTEKKYRRNLILKNISEIKDLPPVFISSNADDPLKNMSIEFVELLKNNNIRHEFLFIKNKGKNKTGHVFNIFYLDQELTIWLNTKMLDFFLCS